MAVISLPRPVAAPPVPLEPPRLPEPRGAVSASLVEALVGTPGPVSWAEPDDDPLVGEDTQLALYLCYELHYRSFAGVDDGWEWSPGLLELRGVLERRFADALVEEAGVLPAPDATTVAAALDELIAAADGPSLSSFMVEQGTREHLREFAAHRSLYQLKEADPHTWGLPRLVGRPKSAMVTIQSDEYGLGAPGRSHAELFASTMTALDLDPTYGAYVEHGPGVTLATCNLVSMFGLHRRWRGALVGHLAVFEMTSVTPMGRYARAVRQLGLGDAAAEFYDVHVQADVEHAAIAAFDLAAGLLELEPDLAKDLLFGASALMSCERRLATHLLERWAADATSLRQPLSPAKPVVAVPPVALGRRPPLVDTRTAGLPG